MLDDREKTKAQAYYERYIEKLEIEYQIEELVGYNEEKKKKIYAIIARERGKINFIIAVITVIISVIITYIERMILK